MVLTPAERNRRWRQTHREEWNTYVRNHRATHPNVILAERMNKLKRKVNALRLLGGKCVVCGETDIRILTINHINGGGNKERAVGNGNQRGGQSYYRALLNGKVDKTKLDLRCYNHNLLYEYERGEWWFPKELPTNVAEFPL